MLSFSNIREHNGVLIFPDDTDPTLFWTLVLGVSATTDNGDFGGQLTLFGRGDPDRASNILGCFWTLTLATETIEPHRASLIAMLSSEDAPARLAPVPVSAVDVTAILTDDPQISASKTQSVWGSGQIALNGQVIAADAPDLHEEWRDGLKDARVEITLTLSGVEPPEMAHASASAGSIALDFDNRSITLTQSTQSVSSSAAQAGARVISYSHPISPGRRAAKDKIILTGFDT